MCYSHSYFCPELRPGVKTCKQEGLRSFITPAREHPKLIYNNTAFFIAIAVADKALFGIESLDDLQQLEVPPGKDVLILNINAAARDRYCVHAPKRRA